MIEYLEAWNNGKMTDDLDLKQLTKEFLPSSQLACNGQKRSTNERCKRPFPEMNDIAFRRSVGH